MVPVEQAPEELVQVMQQLLHPESGLVADRRWRLLKFKQCMVGEEIVGYMVEHALAATRADAVRLGQRLVFHRLLEHVARDHNFKDDLLFYHAVGSQVNPLFSGGGAGAAAAANGSAGPSSP